MLLNNPKTRLVVFVVLGAFTATSGSDAAFAVPLPPVLTVTAKPEKTWVHLNEQFQVRLRVLNTSDTTQSFQVMNCSWDEHWRSSNKQVTWVGWPCSGNPVATETLKPGQAYEKTLATLVMAGAPKDKVSFKMGFTPIDSKRTYWSNEVTVQLVDAATRQR